VIAATTPARLVPFSIHARAAPRMLGIGRVVCVGDAAHAMEPTLGQGGCQALEDAIALGIAAAAGPTTEIVRRFEAMRLARIRTIVARSAEAGLGASGGSALARLRARFTPAGSDARQAARLFRMPRY
jgi:2-polyprenyl-6-methoxyphenol hydroxylase-like FAD-dependent oxidoreductase